MTASSGEQRAHSIHVNKHEEQSARHAWTSTKRDIDFIAPSQVLLSIITAMFPMGFIESNA